MPDKVNTLRKQTVLCHSTPVASRITPEIITNEIVWVCFFFFCFVVVLINLIYTTSKERFDVRFLLKLLLV